MKQVIGTNEAPQAIGTYSQAIKVGNIIYFSGQIGLNSETMQMISADFRQQAEQIFKNIAALTEAAGGTLSNIAKLNIWIIDMENFAVVNEVMSDYFEEPYPARAVVGVKSLPKGALVEVEAIMYLGE